MNRYFAYVRVSTARQSDEGTSPQEQRHAITGYAIRHGLEIARWYEESESAAKQGRPAFTSMLRDMRKARATGVIMHKIDRGARNLKDWAVLLDLVDQGVEVHFAHDSVDLTSRGGRLTANIQAVMAADYSRNLSDEVKKGQLGRLRQGFYPLRAPRGYLDQGKARPKAIDPVQGPLVRAAFERYATGSYSVDMLRKEMAARGLSNRTSPLSRNALTTILHNPFYMGLIRFGTTGELFAGKHEPLISKALFEKVQAVLSGRGGAKVQTHDFLFRRRLRCDACDRTLTGERQKGFAYYRCHGPNCRGTIVREDVVDNEVRATLAALSISEMEIGDFRDVLAELSAEEQTKANEREGAFRIEIAKLDERLSRLADLLVEGTLDRPTYLAKKEKTLFDRQVLVERLSSARDASFWKELSEKFELGFAAYQGYEIGNAAERRSIVDQICSNFTVQQKQPVFSLKFPFAEWANWSKSRECGHSNAQVRTRIQEFLAELRALAPRAEDGPNAVYFLQ